MKLVLPRPSEKQWLLMEDEHKYIAYGGARGGGKSWAIRIKTISLCLAYAGITVMIVRKSYPELRENHIEPMRKMLPLEVATYNESKKEYCFTNGSRILFRYCDAEKDLDRYQGLEADVICIDEATQFSEKVFRVLTACLRGTNDYPKRIYLTCNPSGVGLSWVKRLFIDRHFNPTENPDEYSFIQALVYDNEALMETQPEYVQQLQALPPKMRRAWLEGRWDTYEGQFFEEFTDNEDGYKTRVNTHVISPFMPPKHWQRWRSFDFGYAKPFSCGWWVTDEENRLYRIAELYGCTDTPDEGVKWTVDKIFAEIRRIEEEHPYLKGQDIMGVADPAIWQHNGGIPIVQAAAEQGIYFSKGDNRRIAGWQQVHYRMAFDANGIPMMYVFKTCKAFIRTIPLLVYSDTMPEDLDTKQEDHIADETRYMCMRNPINPPVEIQPQAKQYNPLDT